MSDTYHLYINSVKIAKYVNLSQWYERKEESKVKGYHNRYYDRRVRTSECLLDLKQPGLRNTEEEFESQILMCSDRLEENIKVLAKEMYVSVGDIEGK